MHASLPATRDLVLVGGGHTHALVLRAWADAPLPGARLTLIDPGPTAAYSGMLPGFVAGHYERSELSIDLVRLARRAGARLVLGRAEGIDRAAGTVAVAGRPAIGFDVLSLDIGVTSAMPDLPGFAEHGVPVKPLGPFADAWTALLQRPGRRAVVTLGGGVAGVELALAMAWALRDHGREASVTVVDATRALSGLGPAAQVKLRGALERAGVTLHEGRAPVAVAGDHVTLEDGTALPADFVVGSAGARAYPWLATTGLADAAGFVAVDARLRTADDRIFAVGDCATMSETPRPKAGVYAVRQAPVLGHNLRATLAGTGGLRRYRPQRDYLKLISLGRKAALVERFGLTLAAPALWRWKDRIDRAFMDRLNDRPATIAPAPPWPRARGADTGALARPFCGGCAAKVGQDALLRGLNLSTPGDDAALLRTGDARQVISTDHLRAFVEDPVTLTRIAAVHALGDIWAMGAQPQAALASLILPRLSDRLSARMLAEVTETARAVLAEAGADLVGGHTTMGLETTVGFTVTGLCDRDPIGLAGAQPGDSLILTKPLGSGIVMAADMALLAPGAVVADALEIMAQPQGTAAGLLHDAHAMTDVTGFGLAGHLRALCAASSCGAEIALDRVPVMNGARELAQRGVRGSLHQSARAAFAHWPDDADHALLLDAQTGGGLLAALPGDAETRVRQLQDAGYAAACIGRITPQAGQIDIV